MLVVYGLFALLVEVAMLVAMATWALSVDDGTGGVVLAVAIVTVVGVFWGQFLSPRARRPLPVTTGIWIRAALIVLGAVLLVLAGFGIFGVALGLAGVALGVLEATVGRASERLQAATAGTRATVPARPDSSPDDAPPR